MDKNTFSEPPNPYERFGDIAERLGVKPSQGKVTGVLIKTGDDTYYELADIMEAFLDKMDEIIEING